MLWHIINSAMEIIYPDRFITTSKILRIHSYSINHNIKTIRHLWFAKYHKWHTPIFSEQSKHKWTVFSWYIWTEDIMHQKGQVHTQENWNSVRFWRTSPFVSAPSISYKSRSPSFPPDSASLSTTYTWIAWWVTLQNFHETMQLQSYFNLGW